MPLVPIIAVINQKGGVGKTTTVANLSAAFAARKRPTILIDLDPQANLTTHLGIEPGSTEHSIYDVLTSQASLSEALHDVGDRLWLAPSVIDLAAVEVELVNTVGREQVLADQFQAPDGQLPQHDYVLIDCPPSLGILTLNALAAADEVLIPLQPHFLALQGLGQLLETIQLVRKRINPRLRVAGVILCMYETNTRLAGEVVADLQDFFQGDQNAGTPWADAVVFPTPIRRNIKLAECPSFGTTIFDYDASSNGAQDYLALAGEILRRFAERAAARAAASPAATEPPAAPQAITSASDQTPAATTEAADAAPTPTPEPHQPDAPAASPAGEEPPTAPEPAAFPPAAEPAAGESQASPADEWLGGPDRQDCLPRTEPTPVLPQPDAGTSSAGEHDQGNKSDEAAGGSDG